VTDPVTLQVCVCVRAFAQRSRFADCYKQEVLPLE
jgi:hypothetical protein